MYFAYSQHFTQLLGLSIFQMERTLAILMIIIIIIIIIIILFSANFSLSDAKKSLRHIIMKLHI